MRLLVGALFLLVFQGSQAWVPQEEAGLRNEKPEAIENVGIKENLNGQVDLDVPLVSEDGSNVSVATYVRPDGLPVVFSLVYYSCPSLCNLHLKGVFQVFQDLGLKPGSDFEFVALSIDGKESPDLAQAKKETYLEEFGLSEFSKGVHFLTGSTENVKKVADSVGFSYKWIPEKNEWAHASAAILVTPDGKISRYLHGVYFEPQTFRLSLVETSAGKVGNFVDQVALYCFRYDPEANKYAFFAFNVMRGLAALILLILSIYLGLFWRKQRSLRRST